MGKFWVFLLGMVAGAALLFLISLLLTKSSNNNGVTWFDASEEYTEANQFQVFQIIEQGAALAHAAFIEDIEDAYGISDVTNSLAFMNGPVVLLVNDQGKHYYDDEIVKVPAGKNARQVGVYKYSTKMGYKTVPVISIAQ